MGFTKSGETTFVDKTAVKPGGRYAYRVVALRYKGEKPTHSRIAFIEIPDDYVPVNPGHFIVPKNALGAWLDPSVHIEGVLKANDTRPVGGNATAAR